MYMDMQRYRNLSGESGVVGYELGSGRIVVEFVDGWTYEYTNRSAGPATIDMMQHLARSGRGLSGFIAAHVRHDFARKFRQVSD